MIHAARPDLVHRATPPTCSNCVANPAKVQGDSVNIAVRGVPFFRLVSVILRITAQPVLLQYFRTVVDGSRTFGGVGWDPHRTGSVLQGAGGCEATQAASARLTTGEPLPATLGQVAIEGIPATGGEDSHGCAPPKNCLRLRHYPELTPVFVSPSGLRLSGLAKRKAQPPREYNPNTICLPNTLNERKPWGRDIST